MKKNVIDEAILISKVYLYNYEQEQIFKKKLIKKNKIIYNLSKANFKLKEEINNIIGYNKYYILKY
tara:strand:+ start:676 stop:873 length:198 start_codon:yes stop_codon:yes gene_type:complete